MQQIDADIDVSKARMKILTTEDGLSNSSGGRFPTLFLPSVIY